MSYQSGTNKKNLKIKNISFMSPITRTKINISNLIAETQRIITNSNSNKISQFQNSEINSPKVDINFNSKNDVDELAQPLYELIMQCKNLIEQWKDCNNMDNVEERINDKTIKNNL